MSDKSLTVEITLKVKKYFYDEGFRVCNSCIFCINKTPASSLPDAEFLFVCLILDDKKLEFYQNYKNVYIAPNKECPIHFPKRKL